MQKSVVLLTVLAMGLVSVAPAAAQSGSVAITIPLPVRATLTFGQPPTVFAVPTGMKATVSGTTATITAYPPGKAALPKVVHFSSTAALCFVKGVQSSYTLATAIASKQLSGVPLCTAAH